MKVTCCTLAGQQFHINVDNLDIKVKELKDKIAQEKGDLFPVGQQKLIFSGKILEDEKNLSDCGVTETGFVVVMATKPKPVVSAVPEAEKTPAASKTESVAKEQIDDSGAPKAETKKAEEQPPPPITASTNPPAPSIPDGGSPERENTLVLGEQYEKTVSELCNMGFPRDQVTAALGASFNNPDRAVEYLLSGNIPSVAEAEQQQGEVAASESEGTAAEVDTQDSDFLTQLRRWPQFEQLRRLVAQDQSVLPVLLQQIGQSNPGLLRLIQENQEDFLRYLNESSGTPSETPAVGQNPLDQLAGEQGAAPTGGGTRLLRVTQEERAAIDRLKDLGFPEHMVIEAYFACDKNEDAAANFLLNEGFEDDLTP